MLSEEALNAALPLADILDARRIVISPMPGSPLEKLVSAVRATPQMMVGTDDLQPSISDMAYIASVKGPGGEPSPHDIVMEDVVTVIAPAVMEHVAYARNVVKPAIQDLLDYTARHLAGRTNSHLAKFEVVQFTPIEPLAVANMANMLKPYMELPFSAPSMTLNLPGKTPAEILELMKTGVGSIDEAVGVWVAKKGEAFLTYVWDNVFRILPSDAGSVSFAMYTEDRLTGPDNAMAIFLLASKLHDNPPEGTQHSLVKYNELVADFRNAAGQRLCRALKEAQDVVGHDILVRMVNGSVTTVNAEVYKKFIEAGGTNEMLFGNSLQTSPVFTGIAVREQATQLLAAWSHYEIAAKADEASKVFTITREALLAAFEHQVGQLEDTDPSLATGKPAVLGKFKELLRDVGPLELQNLYAVALRLVCKSRFAHTDAFDLLTMMEEASLANPNIAPREAANAAVQQYVNRYLIAQMVFSIE